MTQIELNAILYYADYMSLRDTSHPVTDTCKYFFIHLRPMNSAYLVGCEPEYDPNDLYIIQSYDVYMKIRDLFGVDAVSSFIEDICSLKACGMVDAIRMLLHIHLYSSKYERNLAFLLYKKWKKDQFYTHQILDEDGKLRTEQCTKYFKHAETARNKRKLQEIS